jgi:hypothetical protein
MPSRRMKCESYNIICNDNNLKNSAIAEAFRVPVTPCTDAVVDFPVSLRVDILPMCPCIERPQVGIVYFNGGGIRWRVLPFTNPTWCSVLFIHVARIYIPCDRIRFTFQ